jgi:hypothetical protein
MPSGATWTRLIIGWVALLGIVLLLGWLAYFEPLLEQVNEAPRSLPKLHEPHFGID